MLLFIVAKIHLLILFDRAGEKLWAEVYPFVKTKIS